MVSGSLLTLLTLGWRRSLSFQLLHGACSPPYKGLRGLNRRQRAALSKKKLIGTPRPSYRQICILALFRFQHLSRARGRESAYLNKLARIDARRAKADSRADQLPSHVTP